MRDVGWHEQEGNHSLTSVNSNMFAEGQEQILIFVFKVSILFYSHTESGVKASNLALGQVREVSQTWGMRE